MAERTSHHRAVIISTGDELMTGQLQDSNSRWLSERLVEVGVLPVEHVSVGDALDDLVAVIRRAAERAPVVIMSGGLGPTDGDLTREAICRASGDSLVLDAGIRGELEAMLVKRGRVFTARQERQAFRPSRATPLRNEFGTAPGLMVRMGVDAPWRETLVFCLPGPPGELRPMFEREVLARVAVADRVVITRLLHVVGLPEADCVDRMGDLTRRDRVPLVGITASGGILTIRIRYEGACDSSGGDGRGAAVQRVDETERAIRAALGDHVLPPDSVPRAGAESLAASVISRLTERAWTVATVESCTGGMLGELLTSISGSSTAYLGGHITYANSMKEALGVVGEALRRHGAVSAEVASQMAVAGLRRMGANFALAITGVAGPGGGTAAKPVGLVHIGLVQQPADGAGAVVNQRRFLFTGDREDIRRRACSAALTMLHFHLCGRAAGEPRLLWEAPAA